MRKLGIGLGVFVGLIWVTLLVAPWLVNVDHYRPQIVSAINQRLNGRVEMGPLSLSLWGKVKVEVAGLKVMDSAGREVVGAQDVYFHAPLLSILTGSPAITFQLNQPLIQVVKDQNGEINLLNLMKKSQATATPSASGAPTAGKPQPGTPQETETKLPAIASRARLGVEIRSALVSYRDQQTGLNAKLNDLNLKMKNLSLDHPTDLELWANLNTQLGKTISLKGPARWVGKAQPTVKEGKLESVYLTSTLDLDPVEVTAGDYFHKPQGVTSQVNLAVALSEKEARIEKLVARFLNAELNAEGRVVNLSAPTVHLSMKSNVIALAPWAELFPSLKASELGGTAQLEAVAQGPSEKLNYHGTLSFNGVTAQSAYLKSKPLIDGSIHLIPNELDRVWMTLKAPGNDIKLEGKVISFTHPHLYFNLTSPSMDLDQLIYLGTGAQNPQLAEKPIKTRAAAPQTPEKASKPAAQSPTAQTTESRDALLEPLRETKALADLVARLTLKVKMLKAYQVRMNDVSCQMGFQEWMAGLDQCKLHVFSGAVKADARFNIKPKIPTYEFSTQLRGIDLAQAVDSQVAMFKNTVKGKADFDFNGTGASLDTERAKKDLKADGKMRISQATFTTIDVTKMVTDAVNHAMEQVATKVPGLQKKTVETPKNRSSVYELVTSNFNIRDGKFNAPDFTAKAVPQQGIDLKGNTTIGITGQEHPLSSRWEVIDTYNLTHLRDVSLVQNGVKVEHLFAEGKSPVHFTVDLGCTLSAPCYSYAEVPEALGKVALNNISQALTGKTQEEARKHAEDLLKNAPPGVQEQLKKLFR